MKKHYSIIILILIIISLTLTTSCHKNKNWEHIDGHFSTTPVNLSFLNTEFDDYNSALNQSGETFPLCFSSNRKTSGAHFDIVYKLMRITYDWQSRDLFIGLETNGNLDVEINNNSIYDALSEINTPYDEFGPFMQFIDLKKDASSPNGPRYNAYVFLYSNDASGNQEIRFVENENQKKYSKSKAVSFLNSPFDDAYPSFNENDSGIYFCSNRNGEFDILFAKVNLASKKWTQIFSDTTQKPIQKMEILSSDSADKCPFILGNTMVFTSNRAGGFGGFDLYYSKFENGKWSTPVNFGPKINTAADEYRPVIRREEGFDNDFMIFSSNRSGGKGGFDLYYVGVDKIPF